MRTICGSSSSSEARTFHSVQLGIQMKVGYHWLQDYITIPWDADELADRLTAIGTAVDGIDAIRQPEGITVRCLQEYY